MDSDESADVVAIGHCSTWRILACLSFATFPVGCLRGQHHRFCCSVHGFLFHKEQIQATQEAEQPCSMALIIGLFNARFSGRTCSYDGRPCGVVKDGTPCEVT